MDDVTQVDASVDPLVELGAMKTVHDAIGGLQPDAQARVLQWVAGALGLDTSVLLNSKGGRHTDNKATRHSPDHRAGEQAGNSNAATYPTFADLLGEAQPQTDAEKALVGGYWFQVVTGAEDFSSQSVNDRLKDTGEAVGNITRAFDRLKAAKPQLVRQLQKTGKTQQARKKLKLTTAGVEQVERMLREER
ncbi:MAG TPA: hypothetical protein VJZ91_06540 [Blastocatellia bacterium]|nr:hypothetical protein [Blastocatellia bacterium]